MYHSTSLATFFSFYRIKILYLIRNMSNFEAFEEYAGKSPFRFALEEWNAGKPKFCIPRKGTEDYKTVMKLMKDKYMNNDRQVRPRQPRQPKQARKQARKPKQARPVRPPVKPRRKLTDAQKKKVASNIANRIRGIQNRIQSRAGMPPVPPVPQRNVPKLIKTFENIASKSRPVRAKQAPTRLKVGRN